MKKIKRKGAFAMLHTFSEYYARLAERELVKYALTVGGDGIEVTAVCDNSSKAFRGCLFVCKGNNFKEEYLADALSKGAACYIAEREYEGAGVPCIIVTDARAALAEAAALYYDSPWEKIPVIGVTGTKGKTTVVYYIKKVLDEYFARLGKKPCGLVSTIDIFDGRTTRPSLNSTPESLELTEIIDTAYRAGLSCVVCEVSSQALKYERVRCLKFKAAVMTNIGIDHISPIEHKDFEDYFSSKLKIFEKAEFAIVNADGEEENFRRMLEAASVCGKTYTYGRNPDASVRLYNVRKTGLCTRFEMSPYSQVFELASPGFFNADNAACACCAAAVIGAEEEDMGNALKKVSVPGRMEVFENKERDIIAIVDYAHNALSFETVFSSVREEYPGYRIISLFGCPGGKAQMRRRPLGEIAGKYSDTVYITSDDPEFEDPRDIAAQIALGVEASGGNWRFIEDRAEASFAAFEDAGEHAVVLLLGCGNETRQKIKGKAVPCLADAECVKIALG